LHLPIPSQNEIPQYRQLAQQFLGSPRLLVIACAGALSG